MKVLVLFVLVSSLLVSNAAFAGVYSCRSTTAAGQSLDVKVEYTDANSGGLQVYESTVKIGDRSIPRVGRCFYYDRPSTRFIKCSHQTGRLRVEIYPQVETTSGMLKLMQFIIWNGDRPEKGDFTSCD